MKFVPIFFLLLFITCEIKAQQNDTTYFDSNWLKTTRRNAAYYRLPGIKEGGIYKLTDYYIGGQKHEEYYSTLPDTIIKTGLSTHYYADGVKKSEDTFENNLKTGLSKCYREKTGELWYTENFKNDKSTGELTSYHRNGAVKTRQITLKDDTHTGKTYDEQGNEISYVPVKVIPTYKGDIIKVLTDNYKYPSRCLNRGIEGRVLVQFVVNTDGKISDVIIKKSIDPSLDKEALRLVKLLKEWKPGITDGLPDKFYFTQPITFKIQ